MAQPVTPPTAQQYGGAKPTAGTTALSISPDRRAAINLSLTAFLDKELGKQVTAALGAHISVGQAALMTASLKTGLRANIGAGLGLGTGVSAGGVGGTAGGGANLAPGTGSSAGAAGGLSGKLGGVPTGSFSLGAGMGTRATTSGTGGASVALGASSTGDFGVGAKAGLGGSAGAGGQGGVTMGAGASIKASVMGALDSAMAGQGLSGAERNQLRAEMKPQVNRAVDDSFHSAFGPDLGYPHANGVQLLGFEVTLQHNGAWQANCEIDHPSDDSPIATGPFRFNIDGVEFSGTVVPDRSGAWGGRQNLYVVGGAGGLDGEIGARNYGGGLTRVKTVIDDILRDAGESLSPESDSALLGQQVAAWQRSAGTAKHALDMICQRIGATWRVLRDGTVWVGRDEWPEVEPAGTVMDQDWGRGHVTVAPDNATLVPGIIVRGQKIKQVTYRTADDGKLRATLSSTSHRGLVDGILERAQRKNQYGYRYRCKVTRQNADGTVDVLTDDDRMKGRGISKCAIRCGFPGATIKVSAGARCVVGWDDADPTLPFVSDWESGTPFDSIDIS